MINQQILDYIKQQLQAGTPKETILNTLIGRGWQQADVHEAFFQATGGGASSSTQPQVQPIQATPAPVKKGFFGRFLKVLFILIIIGILGMVVIAVLNPAGSEYTGQIRTCTKKDGQPLECDPDGIDNRPGYALGGKCLPTIVDGQAPICESTENFKCATATIKKGTYPYCLFMKPSGGHCLPCLQGDH